MTTDFTCFVCRKPRSSEVDGGMFIYGENQDIVSGICAATDECLSAIEEATMRLFDALDQQDEYS